MHTSPDVTALAVLKTAMMLTETHGLEFGGILYATADGHIEATFPLTSGHADRLEGRNLYPADARLAGTYHTHPAGPGTHRDLYSPEDVEDAIRTAVPSYLGLAWSGAVLKFSHGDPVDSHGYASGTLLNL